MISHGITQRKAPADNPDNGLYYKEKVNDATGTNLGLKGIKLNSSGWAAFTKVCRCRKVDAVYQQS